MAESGVEYRFDELPEPGKTIKVAEGVYWLRMTLPFKLNHINLWLLEDGDGWAIVDTGFPTDATKEHWETIFANELQGRPLKRVIVTHFHPDHIGLAGWITRRFDIPMYTTVGEFSMGMALSLENGQGERSKVFTDFYGKAGFSPELMEMVEKRGNPYPGRVTPLPQSYRRISEGVNIEINGREWQIIVGKGHAIEHACLYCEDLKVLISGDQILPRISPNVSVWPQEPEGNPLELFLSSLPKFEHLPDDTLVLPSHDTPFTGLKPRLEQLAHHHDERIEETFGVCATPSTTAEVLKKLFTRELDDHQLFFALGESLAHLHYLLGEGRLKREINGDGAYVFSQA
ncbi:MAG: MBL fold metallo-hydrolase [Rhodospirillales bacterium]|nr:MBL fold metallo-hydrolase [Rhodospirillales bacterium]